VNDEPYEPRDDDDDVHCMCVVVVSCGGETVNDEPYEPRNDDDDVHCMCVVVVSCGGETVNDEPYEPRDDDDDVVTHSCSTTSAPVNQVTVLMSSLTLFVVWLK